MNTLWVAQPSISMMLCELLKGLSKESKLGELWHHREEGFRWEEEGN